MPLQSGSHGLDISLLKKGSEQFTKATWSEYARGFDLKPDEKLSANLLL
jgi:hypothetical protein